MEIQRQPDKKPVQIVVADTNVILYCLSANQDLSRKTRGLLMAFLQTKEWYFGLSEISYYECFKNLRPTRSKEFNTHMAIYRKYTIDESVLSLAANLCSYYTVHPQVKSHMSMSTEDLLIASTGMLTGGYILTTNVYDFPPPFFYPIYKENIIYQDKGVDKMLVFYLLKADYAVFNDSQAEWYKQKQPGAGKAAPKNEQS